MARLRSLLARWRGPSRLEVYSRVAAAYGRASVTAALRTVDPTAPLSWEFSGFSQHGEDGIVDYLCSRMREPNRFFIEIGSADGLRNCSAWLALARRFGGVMVEGNPRLAAMGRRSLRELGCHNVLTVTCQVDCDTIAGVIAASPHKDPDVFILDIDGMDYHILAAVLACGLRPKLIVAEYNSAFGPEDAVTVPWRANFSRVSAHPSLLYYGASIAAWRHLLEARGYHFVTVESNGVNAFFIRPEAFPDGFAGAIAGLDFRDNQSDRNGLTEFRPGEGGQWLAPTRDWRSQRNALAGLPLMDVRRSREG